MDHDHRTKAVRGLLCRQCNVAIARFRESDLRLRYAIAYLEKPFPSFPFLENAASRNDWTTKEGRALYQRRDFLRRNYGISLEQFDWLVLQQEGNCAICLDPLPLGKGRHVDHSHAMGKVRGVLCGDCNVGLGQAKDSAAVLVAAIEYLRKNELPA